MLHLQYNLHFVWCSAVTQQEERRNAAYSLRRNLTQRRHTEKTAILIHQCTYCWMKVSCELSIKSLFVYFQALFLSIVIREEVRLSYTDSHTLNHTVTVRFCLVFLKGCCCGNSSLIAQQQRPHCDRGRETQDGSSFWITLCVGGCCFLPYLWLQWLKKTWLTCACRGV